jgi:predicted nuclease of predicted toxin-antitoxin system
LLHKLTADESVDFRIIEYLRKNGYEIYYISEDSSGINDVEVLKTSYDLKTLLLTEDKDFGEWVFAHKHKTVGVILLRYHNKNVLEIATSLKAALLRYDEQLFSKFTVITISKIRIREI